MEPIMMLMASRSVAQLMVVLEFFIFLPPNLIPNLAQAQSQLSGLLQLLPLLSILQRMFSYHLHHFQENSRLNAQTQTDLSQKLGMGHITEGLFGLDTSFSMIVMDFTIKLESMMYHIIPSVIIIKMVRPSLLIIKV